MAFIEAVSRHWQCCMQDDKRRCSSHSVTSLEAASRSVCKGMQERNVSLESSNTHQLWQIKAFLYFYLVCMHWAAKWEIAASDKSLSVALWLSRTVSIHTTLPKYSFHLPARTCLQSLQKGQPICLPGREGTWCPCSAVPYSLVPGLPRPLGWPAIEAAEPVMISGHWASLQLIVLHCLTNCSLFFGLQSKWSKHNASRPCPIFWSIWTRCANISYLWWKWSLCGYGPLP